MGYTSTFKGNNIDIILSNSASTDYVAQQINSQVDFLKIYPVGSIYLSLTETNPGTFLGGTWALATINRYLVAAGDVYSGEQVGGSADHSHSINGHTHSTGDFTLTTSHMPSHRHNSCAWLKGYSGWTSTQESWGYVFNWDSLVNKGGETTSNVQNSSIGWTAYAGSSQPHNHGVTGSTSLTTNSSTIEPPYFAVYIWKRTA